MERGLHIRFAQFLMERVTLQSEIIKISSDYFYDIARALVTLNDNQELRLVPEKDWKQKITDFFIENINQTGEEAESNMDENPDTFEYANALQVMKKTQTITVKNFIEILLQLAVLFLFKFENKLCYTQRISPIPIQEIVDVEINKKIITYKEEYLQVNYSTYVKHYSESQDNTGESTPINLNVLNIFICFLFSVRELQSRFRLEHGNLTPETVFVKTREQSVFRWRGKVYRFPNTIKFVMSNRYTTVSKEKLMYHDVLRFLNAIYNSRTYVGKVKPLHKTILKDFNMVDTLLSDEMLTFSINGEESDTETGIPVQRKLQIDNILEYCIKIKEQTEAARRLITASFPSY
jgi:hypothetical protein